MLVESTNTLNRAPQGLSVAARPTTSSLPSSSKESAVGPPKRANSVEEGASSAPRIAEDILTLSPEAGKSFAVAANTTPVQHEEESAQPVTHSFTGTSASETEKTSTTDSLIENSLASARSKESQRLEQLQEQLSESLNSSLSLRFKEDSETGIDFFQLIEPESGDVVRQIPAEDVIEFIKKFQSSVSGLFLSEQA